MSIKYDGANSLTKLVQLIKAKLATKSDTGHTHAVSDVTSGTLPLSRGGTGYSVGNTQDLLDSFAMDIVDDYGAIYLDNSEHVRIGGPLPVAYGGTGASNAVDARTNLGAAPSRHFHDYDDVCTASDENWFPIFERTPWGVSSDVSSLPVLPCVVFDPSDAGLYWCARG